MLRVGLERQRLMLGRGEDSDGPGHRGGRPADSDEQYEGNLENP
jgi:hypothetical protein